MKYRFQTNKIVEFSFQIRNQGLVTVICLSGRRLFFYFFIFFVKKKNNARTISYSNPNPNPNPKPGSAKHDLVF